MNDNRNRLRIAGAVAAGFAGLVLAAALSYFALQMVTQPVGLSTVSATTGDRLVANPRKPTTKAKRRADTTKKRRAKTRSDDSSPAAPATPAPATPAPAQPDENAGGGDDSSGRDDSSGEDHGSGGEDDHDDDHDD